MATFIQINLTTVGQKVYSSNLQGLEASKTYHPVRRYRLPQPMVNGITYSVSISDDLQLSRAVHFDKLSSKSAEIPFYREQKQKGPGMRHL